MLCFALQAATEPGCGEASFVWDEPGNEEAGSVHTLLCKMHALRVQANGNAVRPLRSK